MSQNGQTQKSCSIYFKLLFLWWNMCASVGVNPFVPNAPFVYPLKTSKKHKVFWCFQGVDKEYIGNEWVNNFSRLFILSFNEVFQQKFLLRPIWFLTIC